MNVTKAFDSQIEMPAECEWHSVCLTKIILEMQNCQIHEI